MCIFMFEPQIKMRLIHAPNRLLSSHRHAGTGKTNSRESSATDESERHEKRGIAAMLYTAVLMPGR